MKRLIDYYLLCWKQDSQRKPLLLRGARQVGKTYAARKLGKSFQQFVEINFEIQEEVKTIFEGNLFPDRIIRDLSLHLKKPIKPGKTLLFFDEIQLVPKALTALRYFYELMPELHVIAAGSLLDFAIEKVGIPVGRVESRYIFPLSFIEFLAAMKDDMVIQEILEHSLTIEMTPLVHERVLKTLAEYLALGGMPEIVHCWQATNDPLKCTRYHAAILDTYRQDFNKYAKERQIPFVEMVFKEVPRQLGQKFKYSLIDGDMRKRELAPALQLLETAHIVHKVYRCASQGFPFGAQANPTDYKAIFLDVGLAQSLLKLNLAAWFLNPMSQFINKGPIVEAFVGQEILAYSAPYIKNDLYYWSRQARTSQAEVDYILQQGEQIVPVEVKAGFGRTLQSLHQFLATHPQSPYGLRFSTHNYSVVDKIHSYPLYALAKIFVDRDNDLKAAIEFLSS